MATKSKAAEYNAGRQKTQSQLCKITKAKKLEKEEEKERRMKKETPSDRSNYKLFVFVCIY